MLKELRLCMLSLVLLKMLPAYSIELPPGNSQEAFSERALAAVLVGEAGGERKEGLVAVAEVIRNRSREKGMTRCRSSKRKAPFPP